jgi:uncharacterized protein
MEATLKALTDRIRSHFESDFSGHDWDHIQRVYANAMYLQSQEGGDKYIIALGALLHDISDHKMNGGILNHGGIVAREMLNSLNVSPEICAKVAVLVDAISFKGAHVSDQVISLEQQIVQDADRLDAIGAIGIARAFSFGGNRNRPIYQSEIAPILHNSFEEYANAKSHTINHFYEKLLLLKDRMHTDTGKKMAKERHAFMELFLTQFFHEINPSEATSF